MSFIKVTDPRKREELIKDFIQTRKRIKDNFVARKVGESEYQTGLTKLFKPVIETQKATAKEITEAQKEATEKITQGLLPIKDALENPIVLPSIEAIAEKEPILPVELTEKEKKELGGIAVDALQQTHGRKPTQSDIIPLNVKEGMFYIGKTPLFVEENNFKVDGLGEFTGTKGLWNLLTSKDIPVINKDYKKEDFINYAHIMYHTNATRQGFNKDNKRISGNNNKMNNLIKPLVIALEKGNIEEEIKKFLPDEDETDEDETDEYKTDNTKQTERVLKVKVLNFFQVIQTL